MTMTNRIEKAKLDKYFIKTDEQKPDLKPVKGLSDSDKSKLAKEEARYFKPNPHTMSKILKVLGKIGKVAGGFLLNNGTVGQIVLAAIRGIKSGLPIPTVWNAAVDSARKEALGVLNQAKGAVTSKDPKAVKDLIYKASDILDDGQLNKSAKPLNPKVDFIVQAVFQGITFATMAIAVYKMFF